MAKITIKDIAHLAGVSITSVSFAFNNPARLPAATVQRILEAAEELGYVPDPVARSMTSGKTSTLGVLVPQPLSEIIANPFLPEFLEGVSEVCTKTGFSLMLVPPLEGSMRRAIVNAAVDGFLTLGLEPFKATMQVLQQRRIPHVTVDSAPIDHVSSVNVDDMGGARAAMDHVLSLGHRHIVILAIRSGKEGHYEEYAGTLRQRMNGYLAGLTAYGLGIDGKQVQLLECDSTIEGGRIAFQRLWKGRHKPTAVVAMSDIIALGVMHSARQTGLVIPQELSIIGFDDIPFASLACPALTTIAQPLRYKGKLAAELLVQAMDNNTEFSQHLLPTELVIRESVWSMARQG